MTEPEAHEVITALVDGLPWLFSKWSEGQIRRTSAQYRIGIMDLDFHVAKAAVARLLLTARTMPSIAAIREECATVHHGERMTGAEAWGIVQRAMKKHRGIYTELRIDQMFEDPITIEIVRDFGWFDICTSDLPDSVRARFIDAYESIQRRERKRAQILPGAKNPALPPAAAAPAALPAPAPRDLAPRALGDVMTRLLPQPQLAALEGETNLDLTSKPASFHGGTRQNAMPTHLQGKHHR